MKLENEIRSKDDKIIELNNDENELKRKLNEKEE
jgi:hypothetical protein